MDPIEIFREQAKTATALMMEQMNGWIDVCCANLKKQMALPPPPKPLLPQPSVLPPPKEKEEEEEDDFVLEFSPVVTKKGTKKRAIDDDDDDEEGEHSGEIDDDDEDEPEDSFINDDPEDSSSSSSSSEGKEKPDTPPPVSSGRSARVRKAPRRFSPSRNTKEAKKEETKAGRSSISLGSRRATKGDRQEWVLLSKKTSHTQSRNAWFKSRWGTQLDMIRAGLGNESVNNAAPRALWDAIGEKPETFRFRSSSVQNTKCAFCGGQRLCTWKVLDPHGKTYNMGVCCANLAKAWQAFQAARNYQEEDLEEMDRLFEEVCQAHVEKGK